jgi:hypothetical protein
LTQICMIAKYLIEVDLSLSYHSWHFRFLMLLMFGLDFFNPSHELSVIYGLCLHVFHALLRFVFSCQIQYSGERFGLLMFAPKS